MKHPLLILSLLVCLAAGLASCEEETGVADEYAGWRARNEAAFADTLAKARTAIAEAKAAHGDAWEAHCPWRLLRTYALPDGAAAGSTDTVCVYVVASGTGSGSPLYTDSCASTICCASCPPPATPKAACTTTRDIANGPKTSSRPCWACPPRSA